MEKRNRITFCPCGKPAVSFQRSGPVCAECLRIENNTKRRSLIEHRYRPGNEFAGLGDLDRALSLWMKNHGLKQEFM